jgi:hypothetical protein
MGRCQAIDLIRSTDMNSHIRKHILGLSIAASALVAGVGAASAQTTIITREPAPVVVQQPGVIVQERVQQPGVVVQERVVQERPLTLSPEQRTTVYRTIRQREVAPSAGVEVSIGARVPGTVELYDVPQSVAVEVPAVRSYKYMVVNNRVVLVDPATSTIVAEFAD